MGKSELQTGENRRKITKKSEGKRRERKSAFENGRKIANWAHCVLSKFPIMDRPCNLKSFGMVAVSSDSVFLG